ncbi:MAG: hypothetical protein ACE3JK_07975 [Sporolactobacillus sp.]
MQKNNAKDTARKFIETARSYFGNKAQEFSLFSANDEPYKMFSLKFRAYNFYVVILNYDRGHFGCCISFGSDAITLDNAIEWEDNADLHDFWISIDEQLRLRIPDKFLEANNWK